MCNMEQSFISFLEESLKKNWDFDALTDYNGSTLQYKDVARKIEKIHILMAEVAWKKVIRLPFVVVTHHIGE